MVQNEAFGEVVPDHDDGRSDDFGKHVPDTDKVDENPHGHLIDAKSHKGCHDEEDDLRAALMLGMEDKADAEEVVQYERDREGRGENGKLPRIVLQMESISISVS